MATAAPLPSPAFEQAVYETYISVQDEILEMCAEADIPEEKWDGALHTIALDVQRIYPDADSDWKYWRSEFRAFKKIFGMSKRFPGTEPTLVSGRSPITESSTAKEATSSSLPVNHAAIDTYKAARAQAALKRLPPVPHTLSTIKPALTPAELKTRHNQTKAARHKAHKAALAQTKSTREANALRARNIGPPLLSLDQNGYPQFSVVATFSTPRPKNSFAGKYNQHMKKTQAFFKVLLRYGTFGGKFVVWVEPKKSSQVGSQRVLGLCGKAVEFLRFWERRQGGMGKCVGLREHYYAWRPHWKKTPNVIHGMKIGEREDRELRSDREQMRNERMGLKESVDEDEVDDWSLFAHMEATNRSTLSTAGRGDEDLDGNTGDVDMGIELEMSDVEEESSTPAPACPPTENSRAAPNASGHQNHSVTDDIGASIDEFFDCDEFIPPPPSYAPLSLPPGPAPPSPPPHTIKHLDLLTNHITKPKPADIEPQTYKSQTMIYDTITQKHMSLLAYEELLKQRILDDAIIKAKIERVRNAGRHTFDSAPRDTLRAKNGPPRNGVDRVSERRDRDRQRKRNREELEDSQEPAHHTKEHDTRKRARLDDHPKAVSHNNPPRSISKYQLSRLHGQQTKVGAEKLHDARDGDRGMKNDWGVFEMDSNGFPRLRETYKESGGHDDYQTKWSSPSRRSDNEICSTERAASDIDDESGAQFQPSEERGYRVKGFGWVGSIRSKDDRKTKEKKHPNPLIRKALSNARIYNDIEDFPDIGDEAWQDDERVGSGLIEKDCEPDRRLGIDTDDADDEEEDEEPIPAGARKRKRVVVKENGEVCTGYNDIGLTRLLSDDDDVAGDEDEEEDPIAAGGRERERVAGRGHVNCGEGFSLEDDYDDQDDDQDNEEEDPMPVESRRRVKMHELELRALGLWYL